MKKISILLFVICCTVIKIVAQENSYLQKLPVLTETEFTAIENNQSTRLKRETSNRLPGQHSVIVLSGSTAEKRQNAARYVIHKTGMPVYRIRLSLLLDVDILQTEQKLQGIFEVAKNKNWTLLFDEAEALFGKRTDVKNGHDRYNDKAINYFNGLLQLYKGTVILSVDSSVSIHPCIYERYVRFHIR